MPCATPIRVLISADEIYSVATLCCRLGACLAMKHCAEALAKEPELADTYMLYSLQQVVLALRAAESDPAGTGTYQVAAEAMQVGCVATSSISYRVRRDAHTGGDSEHLQGVGLTTLCDILVSNVVSAPDGLARCYAR